VSFRSSGFPQTVRVRGWWRSAGVRVRSTVAATALLAVLVVGGGLGGLALLREALLSVDEETGSVQARLVRLTVTATALLEPDSADRSALATAVGADADRGSHIQVLDADGSVVVASTALAGMPALSGLRPPVSGLERETVDLPSLDRDAPWVLTVVGAQVDRQTDAGLDQEVFYVVVAESTADAQRILTVATVLLGLGVPVLLVAIAVATWTFVGRSLRPVEAIRARVLGITSRGLDGRVPVPPGRDEVSRLAVTMNEMLARLEASQRSQRRFVADASHELRSPVATLRAASDVWAADAGVPRDLIALVAAESGRLEGLVGDLLLLARADEGRTLAERVEVDLDEVVEAEVRRLRQVAPGLRIVFSAVPVRVVGDPSALARAVRNLTDNAVRHASSLVELHLVPEQDGAQVRVLDDGPGIPEADRERVLERFVRLDASRQRGSGGTGLGLAIVAEIAVAHGGSVRVGERPGGGCAVVLVVQPPSAASR
jgi:signal transduction histidine kinase